MTILYSGMYGDVRTYLRLAFIVLLCLSGVFAALSDVFLTWPNILNIFTASSTIGLLAMGAVFIIGAGGLDLSVGSLMALSASISALLIAPISESLISITFFSLGTGVAVGALNGLLIGRMRLPAFIVTLAMLSLARGLSLILTDGRPIYGLPEAVVFLGQGKILGIGVPVLFFLGFGSFTHILLKYTKFGWHTLALGDNEKAARNAGIRTDHHIILLYALSGFLAAVAGLLFMGRVNAADPSAGIMYELTAITAAIIGGTSLSGGRASIPGAMLGALIMGVLHNGLTLVNVAAYYQQVAVGIVLIAAVTFARSRNAHAS